jgi:hypothetical protein
LDKEGSGKLSNQLRAKWIAEGFKIPAIPGTEPAQPAVTKRPVVPLKPPATVIPSAQSQKPPAAPLIPLATGKQVADLQSQMHDHIQQTANATQSQLSQSIETLATQIADGFKAILAAIAKGGEAAAETVGDISTENSSAGGA